MHPDLEKLLELQQADAEILRLNQEIAALPKRVADIETKLAGVTAQVERAKGAMKDVDARRRKHESDIQTLQQKVSKYRDQTLSVKTNQEYRALLDEIGFAEVEIRKIEDKILEGMVETEERQKEVRSAETELNARKAEIEKEKSEARVKTDEDQKRLAVISPKRDGLRKAVDADLLRHYDRLLKLRGSALAEVKDQKCCACQVILRQQVWQDVRSDTQVLHCDSCHRILYFIPEPENEPNKPLSEKAPAAEPAVAATRD
jgi:predicted  nucleic acid-binding Zn-ribbon protein